jgi:nucleotide-binding universal stress UspA family protein
MREGPLKVETLVQRGDPVTEILRMAEDGASDLIVMGTHGRSGIKRALLGSVAENVVHRAPCPVLVVHSDDAQPAGAPA